MTDLKDTIKRHYTSIVTGESCCATVSSCCSGAGEVQDVAVSGLGCGLPLKYADLRAGEVVLDLGSGPGIELLTAARKVGPGGQAIGVDMTEKMIETARQRALDSGVANVEFILADIEALPIESESIDVIISNCVINLAPDKKRVFEEMFRVLKPGGRFVVSDIVTRGSLPEYVQKDPEQWAACVAGALKKDLYLSLLDQAGFDGVLIRSQTDAGSFDESCSLISITAEGHKN